MNLINVVTLEYPRSLWQLRQENPNVSFPATPTDEDLAPFDHACIHPTPQPTLNSPRTERLEEGPPAQGEDGTWRQTWTVRQATEEEIAAYDENNRPTPDWARFKGTLLGDADIAAAMGSAMAQAPTAVLVLPPALMAAASGQGFADFRGAWLSLRRASLVSTEILTMVTALAIDCNLPADFVDILS